MDEQRPGRPGDAQEERVGWRADFVERQPREDPDLSVDSAYTTILPIVKHLPLIVSRERYLTLLFNITD